MNVGQLKEFLSEFPDDMLVTTAGSDGLVDLVAEYIGTGLVYKSRHVVNPMEVPVSKYVYHDNGTDVVEVLVL